MTRERDTQEFGEGYSAWRFRPRECPYPIGAGNDKRTRWWRGWYARRMEEFLHALDLKYGHHEREASQAAARAAHKEKAQTVFPCLRTRLADLRRAIATAAHWSNGLVVVGAAAIATGAYWIYPPAGLIVGGAAAILLAMLIDQEPERPEL